MKITLWDTAVKEEYDYAMIVEKDAIDRKNKSVGGAQKFTPEQSFDNRWDSSCGERAGAIVTGLPRHKGVGRYKRADLGIDVDVKTRPDKKDCCGIPYGVRVTPKALKPWMFYLLVVSVKRFEIYDVFGGIYGKEILEHPDHSSWISNPGGYDPVFWVPREFLHWRDDFLFSPEMWEN